MEESSSKELLQFETISTAAFTVCNKDGAFSLSEPPFEKPTMFRIPKSQVIGKLKDFLGFISESNKKLLHDAKNLVYLFKKEKNFIIIVLMMHSQDLMLGVADLHTPEAVAAAESAIAGNPPPIHMSISEDSSDEEDDSRSINFGSKDAERESSRETSRKAKTNKRSKIVELL
ncbi:hypothetical protein ACJIZ3_013600 [Penstemon smallii]|uniref:Uncharacterized protein n=1 Tax=Penstemon smallii TaxID=265156 RepID=A0ABD3RJ31_9LAMI